MTMFTIDNTNKISHQGAGKGVVKKGDSQTDINENLAGEIEILKEKTDAIVPVTNSSDEVLINNTFGEDSVYNTYDKTFSVSTVANASGVEVKYDINSLLVGNVTNKRVKVESTKNNSSQIIYDSKSNKGSFNLSSSDFPATLIVEVRKSNADKDENITSRVSIQSTNTDSKHPAYTRNVGKSTLVTQTDANNYLEDRVNTLNRSLDNIATVSLDGSEYSIADAITKLWDEIKTSKVV